MIRACNPRVNRCTIEGSSRVALVPILHPATRTMAQPRPVSSAATGTTRARSRRPMLWTGLSIVVAVAGVVGWRLSSPGGGSTGREWAAIEEAVAARRFGDAEARLHRWLGRAPGDGKALLRLGAVLAVQGRDDEAKDVFLRISPGDPAWSQAQRRLGESWLRHGYLREAERAFRNAIADRPRAVEPRRRLVYALTLSQRNDEARTALWDFYRLTRDPRHLVTMSGLSAAEPDAR